MNHEQIKVSVIVPIYNSEKFLPRCIESILRQTYNKLEIILVDDGSTDSSTDICNSYAKADNRVIVIEKNNGGNISARKEGVKSARGDYIGFVDSDDWIDGNMYEKLVEQTDNGMIDMVTSAHYIEDTNVSAIRKSFIASGRYTAQEEMKYIRRNMIFQKTIDESGITYPLWSKLFRRSIMEDIIFKIDDECTLGEDAACVFLFLLKSSSLSVLDEAYYHYCVNMKSVIHSYNDKYLIGINKIYIVLKQEFEKMEDSEILLHKLERYMVYQILRGMNYYMGFSDKVNIPLYHFPVKHIEPGSTVILYGAGQVGRAYYKQLKMEGVYQIAGWVDQKYELYTEKGLEVRPLASITSLVFDYVIIAALRQEVADTMKMELTKQGVVEDKIIWYKPVLWIQ